MITQSASTNRKLSNIIAAGVIFTVLSVVVSALWILFSYRQVLNMRAEFATLKDSVSALHGNNNPISDPQPVKNTVALSTKPEPKKATQKPLSKDKDTVKTAFKPITKPVVQVPTIATALKPELKKESTKPLNRKGIVLSYYYRRSDNENLETTLQGLGYNFDIKEQVKNTGYQKSNCIWFGADVPLSEVKRVAIAMIQSGNTVKGIKRFPLSAKKPAYKRNVIEVGLEMKFENYYTKPLSIVEIERAKNFK